MDVKPEAIEAIRARRANISQAFIDLAQRRIELLVSNFREEEWAEGTAEFLGHAMADIDTLLAELDTLRQQLAEAKQREQQSVERMRLHIEEVVLARRECDERHRLQLAAEATLAEAEASRIWQPIETAPKDGTRVLVYSEEFRRRIIGVAYYWRGVPGDGEGWIARSIYSQPEDDFRGALQNPILWMPLPIPPAALLAKEGK